jgi:hypothetical protein
MPIDTRAIVAFEGKVPTSREVLVMSHESNPTVLAVVPLKFHLPDCMTTNYANEFVAQLGDGILYFHFFEVITPITYGSPEEQISQLKEITSVQAKEIARIAMPLSKVSDVIKALTTVLNQTMTPFVGDPLKEAPQ